MSKKTWPEHPSPLPKPPTGWQKIRLFLTGKYYRWLRLRSRRLRRQCSPRTTTAEQHQLLKRALLQESQWNLNYIVLVIASCLIASFGLIANSTAVIIGAMLIAPLMLPLRAMSFGALEGEWLLFRQSLLSILGGTILACGISWSIGRVVGIPEFQSEVLSRTQPNLIDLGIAVAAGAISSFAKIREGISDALAGTAIAVALMPPLCVVGLCLSQKLWQQGTGAFLLYVTNLLGIFLACMVVFIFAGYAPANRKTLTGAITLTALLLIPLGARFFELVRQARLMARQEQLEAEIQRILTKETITVGQGVENAHIVVDWNEKKEDPPLIYIGLETEKAVTPKQVKLVEDLLNNNAVIQRQIGQRFQLIFFVSKVERITANDPEVDPATNDSPTPGITVPIPADFFDSERFNRYQNDSSPVPIDPSSAETPSP